MKKLIISVCAILLMLSACAAPPIATEAPNIPESPTVENFQTWQDAYAEFLRKSIPVSDVDTDTFADDSEEQMRFGAFLAGGYPVAPFFYLYDIDNDTIPELIYIDPAYGYDADVYTYGNNQISKTGGIKFYPFGSLGKPLNQTEGLCSDTGYKRHYGEMYLYTMNSGVLTEQMILEYNNQQELSQEHPGELYAFNDFSSIDYYEVTEANISKVIYDSIDTSSLSTSDAHL